MTSSFCNCVEIPDAVEDSFQAFLVEGASFTYHEEYPILRPDMIAQSVPSRIMPFNKAITYHGDLRNTLIVCQE